MGCGGRVDVAAGLSRRRTTLMRTVKSRGPDTPTLVSAHDAFMRCRAHGGQQARRTGENAKQPLKPSRGECRDVSAKPVVPAACIFFAGGPDSSKTWGRPTPGIPCALYRGRPLYHPSDAKRAARTRTCVPMHGDAGRTYRAIRMM